MSGLRLRGRRSNGWEQQSAADFPEHDVNRTRGADIQSALNVKTKRWLIGATISGLYLYSMTVFLLGILLPDLTERFSLSPGQQGQLFFILNAAIFFTVFLTGPVIDAIGKRPIILSGSVLIGLAFCAIGQVRSLPLLYSVLFLLGLGAGAINIACNTLIPELDPDHPAVAYSLANLFFGLGGITLPLMSSLWLTSLGMERFLYLISLFALLPLLQTALITIPHVRETINFRVARFYSVFTLPLYGGFALLFFFYGGLEVTTAGWLKTYLLTHQQFSETAAGWLLTVFSCMLLVGRLLGSYFLIRMEERRVVAGSALLAVVGLLLFSQTGCAGGRISGLILAGLAYAPIFPASLGIASKLYKNQKDMVIGTLLGWGVLGGVVTPYSLGLLGGDIQYIAIIAACLFFVQVVLYFRIPAGPGKNI
jgi:fucose permease